MEQTDSDWVFFTAGEPFLSVSLSFPLVSLILLSYTVFELIIWGIFRLSFFWNKYIHTYTYFPFPFLSKDLIKWHNHADAARSWLHSCKRSATIPRYNKHNKQLTCLIKVCTFLSPDATAPSTPTVNVMAVNDSLLHMWVQYLRPNWMQMRPTAPFPLVTACVDCYPDMSFFVLKSIHCAHAWLKSQD